MKCIVVYNLGTMKSAFCFDNRNDAVDYINTCSEYADNHTESITEIDPNTFKMVLDNGKTITIEIKLYPDSDIRYDVSFYKNGRHIETRRFTKRELAVKQANKILDDIECVADPNEDDYGEWTVDDPNRNLKATIQLELVIVGERVKGDYDILGLSNNATKEEVRKAYHKLAIKYHPDTGGDQKKFEEIHMAYQRIMDGTENKGRAQKVFESYSSLDVRCLFKNYDKIREETKAETYHTNDYAKSFLYSSVREKARSLMLKGLIEFVFGAGITAISYNSAAPGGTYVVFGGLIFMGIINFFRGIFYLAFPSNALK